MPSVSKVNDRVFIIAGGESSRMRRDKARLLLGSRTFLERITDTARELDLPVDVISEDDVPGLGPLGGVSTAFRRYPFKRALFLPCDQPLISHEFLRSLLNASRTTAVFTENDGQVGFPFVLHREDEAILNDLLASKRRSLQELCRKLAAPVYRPSKSEAWQVLNVNTPADHRTAVRIWSERRRSDAVLEIRRLTVQRGRTELIADFSWRVRKNEHWVVLGANGCGKTSLFSSLLGYVTPTRGDIFLLGEEFGDSDWPTLRQRIGLVSSSVRQMMADTEPAWISVASGKYAIIDFWGTPKKADKREALQLLHQIECDYLSERPWAYLSQGERQRVLIARALMAHPAVLILDEPCAGLDPAAREHFLHFLDRFGRQAGSPAIILVTHHVEEVMPVFTHALLMKKGRKLAEGPVSEMLTSAQLTSAFETPIRVRRKKDRFQLEVRAVRNVIA